MPVASRIRLLLFVQHIVRPLCWDESNSVRINKDPTQNADIFFATLESTIERKLKFIEPLLFVRCCQITRPMLRRRPRLMSVIILDCAACVHRDLFSSSPYESPTTNR